MAFEVVVIEPDAFDRWLAGQGGLLDRRPDHPEGRAITAGGQGPRVAVCDDLGRPPDQSGAELAHGAELEHPLLAVGERLLGGADGTAAAG